MATPTAPGRLTTWRGDRRKSRIARSFGCTPIRSARQVRSQGRDVLEVGCGRGGGSAWIARTQGARSVTGVDLSSRAIALCKRLQCAPNLTFRRGDAEKLPFPNASFDVVVNVESCHHYPSLPTFFDEVERVLRPGGSFCVATYWDPPGLARFERALRDTSLELVRTADIAPRVMDSLRATDAMKTTVIRRHAPWWLRPLLNHFTAVEGSRLYRGFMDGSIAYVFCPVAQVVVTCAQPA